MASPTGEDLTGLGRIKQHDPRNAAHPMPTLVTEVRHRLWNAGAVLDQGSTPQCVGYAGWGWLAGGPVTNKPKFSPTDLYKMAQARDEWPGDDYDGSSTLGLMKALKDAGYIKEYVWATDAETLVSWILAKGPVVVGTNWWTDMFTPDRWGFLDAMGQIEGGHEYRLVGAYRDKTCPDGSKGAVRMVNSWGRGWGSGGRAWISFATLDKLIKDDGEAVTAPEIKL
jgi:hypothetical protein